MAITNFNVWSRFKRLRNRRVLWLLVAVLLLAGTAAALDAKNVIDIPGFKDTPGDKINYDPPTEAEKKETEAFKKAQVADSAPVSTSPASGEKKSVVPYITSYGYNKLSGQAEASGYVPDVIEDGGTCALTLKKDGQVVVENKAATQDAQNTSCGLLAITRDRLSPGTWTATLSYSSPTAEGTSKQVSMEVE